MSSSDFSIRLILLLASALTLHSQGWLESEGRQEAFIHDKSFESKTLEGWRHGVTLFATTLGEGDRPIPIAWGQGLGTAIRGQGMAFEHIFTRGNAAASVSYRLGRDSVTGTHAAELLTWSLAWRPKDAWLLALEQEPLVWGQGLQGGYLLGAGAAPFPKARVRTPWWNLRLFGIPLGTWRGEGFVGRLEDGRVLATQAQNPYALRAVERVGGEVDQPLLSGWRAEARFGPKIDFAIGIVSMWGGRNRLTGKRLDQGWAFGDYATAFFGLDTALAERDVNYTEAKPVGTVDFVNKARSNALVAVDIRLRPDWLKALVRAERASFYLTRGADSANWQYSQAFRRPWGAFFSDVDRLRRNLEQGRLRREWNNSYRDFGPSLDQPQDTLGVTFLWSGGRDAAVEYSDTVNSFVSALGFRTYTHEMWPAGHSRKGDMLGHPFGADLRLTKITLGLPMGMAKFRATLAYGQRPFRDSLTEWRAANGSINPAQETFTQGDLSVQIRLASWEWSLRSQARVTDSADHIEGQRRWDTQVQLLARRVWMWR